MMERTPSTPFLAAGLAVLLAGCAGTESPELDPAAEERLEKMEQMERERLALERQRRELERERADMESEETERELEGWPDWALSAPASDGHGVAAVGVGRADQPDTAVRMARLEAEFGLAAGYEQLLSGSERMDESVRGGETETDYRLLIDRFVADVPVHGYETMDQEVRVIDGEPHAFIRLYLPFDAMEEAMARNEGEDDDRMRAAFADLERRLDEHREREAESEQAEHERELERIETASEAQARLEDGEEDGGDEAGE